MALKKSQLYSSLWASCDELRGGMDASQYKDYILTLLFMKYVSDKHAGDPNFLIEVPKGANFADMVKLKGNKDIGEKINKIISKLAKANELQGVIDLADFNNEDKLGRGKEMKERLSKLVAIFEDLDLSANRAEGDDLLGDAYEYLMRHFATESGKSKGQFYTPAEVSRILAKVIGVSGATRASQSVYDPACGSGSLLLKVHDEAPVNITIYGQEKDNATWALARMNMFLHNCPAHEIWQDNTLSTPYFKNKNGSLKTFDFAVVNPPFSDKTWTTGFDPANDEFNRFEYGVPPAKKGDYAYLLHVIASLKSKGKAAVILPHGVLFRGNKEEGIRKKLITRGLIKGIISLPKNLFYGTSIPACIIVIDKENAADRTDIFMINASKGFMKDGNKNRLREQDIHKIVDVFNNQIEVDRYARLVPVAEIASEANDNNLNIPRYIDSNEPEDLHDLDAHLNGGIPVRDVDALEPYWSVFPSLRDELFQATGRPGYCEAKVETHQVKPTILDHPECHALADAITTIFDEWKAAHEPLLNGLKEDVKPKEVIHTLSEDILSRFADVPLLNRYNIYQRLMDYWAEMMQDDLYMISANGWVQAAHPRGIIDDKAKKIKEKPDLTIKKKKYKMDLIPPVLVVSRYFADEQVVIDNLQTKQEAAAQELEEFVEEYTGEDGLLEDATNDKGMATKDGVKDRLKALKDEPDIDEEYDVLSKCLNLIEAVSKAKKAVKEVQADLDCKVLAKYPKLDVTEIKTLVVDEKWLASIQVAIDGEVQRLMQRFAGRIRDLEERYAATLTELKRSVEKWTDKSEEHLKKMGLVWV